MRPGLKRVNMVLSNGQRKNENKGLKILKKKERKTTLDRQTMDQDGKKAFNLMTLVSKMEE